MGWKDLLQAEGERVISPWIGGRSLRAHDRTWTIEGRLPAEHGWYTFKVTGRTARVGQPVEALPDVLKDVVKGYLVGDHLVPDDVRIAPSIAQVIEASEPVYLIEPGLDRFIRVAAGRPFEDGPLVYVGLEFPLGPEEAVLQAFLDGLMSVSHVAGVAPALDVAFRIEVWRRVEAEKRRREEAEQRRKEEEARQREERRQAIVERLGDGQGRREMAAIDFGAAALAALAVGGAQYLDHRHAPRRGEMIVRFRLDARRYECVCSQTTLRIIDSGICLTAHYDDPEFTVGTKGDTFFTLESLPNVIRQAVEEGKLVVYRQVD